jgi:multisubunit Na+/H+ antiporter MnhB subunit
VQLSTGQIVLWAAGLLAQLYLAFLIARNRIWKDLPVFSSYVVINLFAALLIAATYIHWGTQATQSWSVFWAFETVTIVLRIMVSVEAWRKTLKPYPGIWALAWKLLTAVGVLGLLVAYVQMYKQQPTFRNYMFSAKSYLELASAMTLIVFLLFCRYYTVSLEPALKAITVGICFYSALRGLNDTIVNHWSSLYVPVWRYVILLSFECTLVIWWWGLRVPRRATERPVLYPPEVYPKYSLQVNEKLRRLNEQLEGFLKP